MKKIYVWLRRDLRLEDHHALYQAAKLNIPIQLIFIFDPEILNKLEDKNDARVTFIHRQLQQLNFQLQKYHASIQVEYGEPNKIWQNLAKNGPLYIFSSEDYEPYAIHRDLQIANICKKSGGELKLYKDQVVFDGREVLKDDGTPYTVFTPYSKKWKAHLLENGLANFNINLREITWAKETYPFPGLKELGFEESSLDIPSDSVEDALIKKYQVQRDFPGMNGTSRLGIHLRFGTISIRKLVARAMSLNVTFLNELIWREFYSQILFHFPQVVNHSFKPKYDEIPWVNDIEDIEKWKAGQTGYPMVDAGMRELVQTGFMHNRARMITASFLTKHLLVDWRIGEAYFARHLLDFDLASNNGGWQWAAGSGTDAAPYFRVFNPTLQQAKFDPQGKYITRWIPELTQGSYPRPMIPHEMARDRCLKAYQIALRP